MAYCSDNKVYSLRDYEQRNTFGACFWRRRYAKRTFCNCNLFGYYECVNGIEFAEKTQAGSPIVDKWNVYMADVLELEMDPVTGAQPKMQCMFLME